jgi:hypothetical protein
MLMSGYANENANFASKLESISIRQPADIITTLAHYLFIPSAGTNNQKTYIFVLICRKAWV